MKVIDKRKNEYAFQFCELNIGKGFEYNGKPYIKTSDEYAFDLAEIREEEVMDCHMIVIPLDITIIIEK